MMDFPKRVPIELSEEDIDRLIDVWNKGFEFWVQNTIEADIRLMEELYKRLQMVKEVHIKIRGAETYFDLVNKKSA